MRFTGYHVKLIQPRKNVQVQMTRPTEERERAQNRGIKTCLQDRSEGDRLKNGFVDRQTQNYREGNHLGRRDIDAVV